MAIAQAEQELQEPCLEQYLVDVVVAAAAESAEKGSPDIWEDQQVLHYLQHQQHQPQATAAERNRVQKRAAGYTLAADGTLRRQLADGSSRIVPKPAERKQLIQQFHQRNGHYGVRRTGALVQTSYWWWGLWADVAAELSKCALCSRARSSFNKPQPELHPLPICGLMYRWGVDLAGPLPETPSGSLYVMIAVEHYSKHLELVPLPNKEPATTAAAFAAAVLGRYGSPAEVLTDRGGEWQAAFDQLLLDCMIDHRRTSANHPQADGLAERCVQTVKAALSKLCAEQGSQQEWDRHLPWLMLGYNASPQKATGLSPYQLMHAVTPIVPPAARQRLEQPMNLDDPAAAAADFLRRAQLVKQRSIIAGENLRIAQQRDTLRYAQLRSGQYSPQMQRFLPQDYVYVQRKDKQGLDIRARRHILRVTEVRPSGVLILQGRCGTHVAVHSSHCTPCHLPNVDGTIDWSLGRPPATAVCEGCSRDEEEQLGQMIFCDNCNSGWHLSCCQPALSRVPRGTWVCHQCANQGITLEAAQGAQQLNDRRAAQQLQPEKLTPAELRARAMHGRLLKRWFQEPAAPGNSGRTRPVAQAAGRWFVGKVWFRGPRIRQNLIVTYEDGDVEFTNLGGLSRAGVEWLPEGTAEPLGASFMTAAEAEAELLAREQEVALQQQRENSSRRQRRQGAEQQGEGATEQPSARPAPAPVAEQPPVRRSSRRSAAQKEPAAAVSLLKPEPGSAAPSSSAAGAAGTPATKSSRSPAATGPKLQQQDLDGLPPEFDLQTAAGVQRVIQLLMPGSLADKDASRMCNAMTEIRAGAASSAAAGRGFVPTDSAEVEPLLGAVDFTGVGSFFDPFAGSGTIARVFQAHGFEVSQNDICSFWGHTHQVDALQPYAYAYQASQVLVSSPPFELLDLAVPLLVAAAGVVACVHVPGHWLTNARVPRQRWLQELARQGRMHVVFGLPRGPAGRRCAWVLIFRSAGLKQQLLVEQPSLPVSYWLG